MKKIYYISSREIVDGIIHEATVIKETAKTYIAEINGYERTLRKTDMSFGYIEKYRAFEEYTDALMWLKERVEKLIIGNTDTIYKKTLENEKLRALKKRIIGDAIASVNADEDTAETESKTKAAFVKNYLSPLLRAARICVRGAEYVKDEKTDEETVVITCTNGYTREKCVTADSLIALARDSMQGL